MNDVVKYFPNLTPLQIERFSALKSIYEEWNSKINVISRKDMDDFYIHHVLHSLFIAKIISFKKGSKIMDVGTGGGFPGIPLAILFEDSDFLLVDSIGKKIKVVGDVANRLGLTNVNAVQSRAENINQKFDFIVSRAVTAFPDFVGFVKNSIATRNFNDLHNGILYLKGGDFENELSSFKKAVIYPISNVFQEPFYETKKLIYLPM